MQDEGLVAAIVAGDPEGFVDAYDRYAAPLYAYCSFMLSSPEDAAGAVRDTFLIASSRLERLRDPAKLRPWLHAVARNECQRRLGAAGVTSRPQKTRGDGALPAAELPASLRGEVLRACTDSSPAGRADRASVAHHAGTFGPTGFPKSFGSPAPWWRRHPRAAAVVATVAAAAVAGGLVAMLTTGGPHRTLASIVGNGGGPGASGPPTASVAPGASGSPGTWVAPGASGSPGASGASLAPGQPTPAVTVLGRITSPASPASTRTTPAPSASPSGTSASPSPSPSVSPSIVPGVLEATPATLRLTSANGKSANGSFLLSAAGGPVSHYVITIPAAMTGKVTVSPASGSLGARGWVTVKVTVTSKVALDTRLIINPGNIPVTIVYTLKR
jgi:Sigma-70 region 2